MNVLIVNYNTQKLTDCAIRSLNKHTQGCKVYVFDNSDRAPFMNDFANVEVINNTKGQIINWERWLRKFPFKYPTKNNWGSAKHCKSVDICFDLIPEGFILMDSDILIKRDITDLWDECAAAAGQIVRDTHFITIPRLAPYLCFINVPACLHRSVRYFNSTHMWKLVDYNPNRFYDTGAWFLERLNNKWMPIKDIDINDYMIHLRNGSWRGTDYNVWLKEHEDLWV